MVGFFKEIHIIISIYHRSHEGKPTKISNHAGTLVSFYCLWRTITPPSELFSGINVSVLSSLENE